MTSPTTGHGAHGHADPLPSKGRGMTISAWLMGCYFFVIELGIGLWTGSIAVLSDAFHTLLHSGRRPGGHSCRPACPATGRCAVQLPLVTRAERRLSAGGDLLRRLLRHRQDALHRPDPGRDPHGHFDHGQCPGRHALAGDLFPGPGPALPGQPPAAQQVQPLPGPPRQVKCLCPTGRRRDPYPHGLADRLRKANQALLHHGGLVPGPGHDQVRTPIGFQSSSLLRLLDVTSRSITRECVSQRQTRPAFS